MKQGTTFEESDATANVCYSLWSTDDEDLCLQRSSSSSSNDDDSSHETLLIVVVAFAVASFVAVVVFGVLILSALKQSPANTATGGVVMNALSK